MSLKALFQAILEQIAKVVVSDESAVKAVAKAGLHLVVFGLIGLTHLLLEVIGAPSWLKWLSLMGVIPIVVPWLFQEFRQWLVSEDR